MKVLNLVIIVPLTKTFLTCIYYRYSHDEESLEDQEESGWKYIHGDVFRFPQHKSLFSAVIGSGTQLLAL